MGEERILTTPTGSLRLFLILLGACSQQCSGNHDMLEMKLGLPHAKNGLSKPFKSSLKTEDIYFNSLDILLHLDELRLSLQLSAKLWVYSKSTKGPNTHKHSRSICAGWHSTYGSKLTSPERDRHVPGPLIRHLVEREAFIPSSSFSSLIIKY